MGWLTRVVVVGVAVGCGRGEPVPEEIVSLGAAVDAWEAGHGALAAGDAVGARAAFARARTHRPDDVLLSVWEARAAEAGGDVAGARAILDGVLGIAPRQGHAAWARARLRVLAGDRDGAVDDLIAALRAGVGTPHRARRDPALAGLVGHTSAPFLPAEPLSVVVDLASGPWFLGSEGTLNVTVRGLVGDAPLVVDGDPAWRGPASVVRVASTRAADASGEREAEIAWTWRVDGAGTLTVGPLRVAQGDAAVRVDAVSVALVAPPSRAEVPSREGILPLPSAILGDRPVPSVWRSDGVVWVALPDDARVTEPADAPRPWRYDPGARDLPGTALVPLPPSTARVVARGEAGVLLDEVVSGGEGATGERRR